MKKIGLVIFTILVVAGFVSYVYWRIRPQNVRNVIDETLGISFVITKDFNRIGTPILQSQNPSFVYGFTVPDIEGVKCIISQTKRLRPGYVSPEQLKDGTYNQIKKGNPTVALEDWQTISIGNGLSGAWLTMSYKQGKATYEQIEVVGTTDERTTFAFCSAPASLYKFYQSDFNTFLSSIRIQ